MKDIKNLYKEDMFKYPLNTLSTITMKRYNIIYKKNNYTELFTVANILENSYQKEMKRIYHHSNIIYKINSNEINIDFDKLDNILANVFS